MRRSDLEHIISASGDVADDNQIVIVGSQSILGQFPDAPASLLMSMEADVYPKHKPAQADSIDFNLGEGSRFHESHGYYAQGVGPETAVLPRDWQGRLVAVNNDNTNGISGLCLEVHDLAISKLVAGRTKDMEFLQELIRHGMTSKETLDQRLQATKLSNSERKRLRSIVEAMYKA